MAEIGAIAGVIFAYGIVSRTLGRYNISGPMIFAAIGIVCGPSVLGIADYRLAGHSGLVIAEIALVVVLFADASRTDLGELRNDATWAGRLLVIGMPLTIMAGTVTAFVLVGGIEFWEAAVLAAVLAPTDAALGHAVVSSTMVPTRIRQTINVEAGLNDGLSIPFLFLFLGLAVDQASLDAAAWFTFGVQQVALGAAVGIVAGGGGGWLVLHAVRRRTITYSYERMVMVAIAVGSWAVADLLGGNGFIAAFVAGLAVSRFAHDFGERILDFAEREGQLLSVIVFFVFGTAAIGFLDAMTWQIAVFVVVALTVNRMVPVGISLVGTHLNRWTVGFIGWFGPRGLASIILILVAVTEEPDLPGLDIVLAAVTATVLSSVLLHGITANPLTRLYSRRVVRGMSAESPELTEGEVPRPRRV